MSVMVMILSIYIFESSVVKKEQACKCHYDVLIIPISCPYIYCVITVNSNKHGYIVYIFTMHKGDNVIGGSRFIVTATVPATCYSNELLDRINIHLRNLQYGTKQKLEK